MAQDLIRYDLLAQNALRGVIRAVLDDVAQNGLPGEHHFYIAFNTTAPGVRISNRLRERYPEEMTVVMQHQYWDLEVTEVGFSVSLSFNGVPERLVVPFGAVKGFFDPSVQFGLQFEPMVEASDDQAGEATSDPADGAAVAEEAPEMPEGVAEAAQDNGEAGTADVVSLDQFRRKT
jgi:uncharacterized protein